MGRQFNVETEAALDGAARFYSSEFLRPTRWSPNETPTAGWAGVGKFKRCARAGRHFVLQSLYNATFKDEYDYLIDSMRQYMGVKSFTEFEDAFKEIAEPREDAVFEALLRERLACDLNGDHIEGCVGKVEIGRRIVNRIPIVKRIPRVRPKVRGHPEGEWEIFGYYQRPVLAKLEWPIYAGEGHERAANRIRSEVGADEPGADPLPETAEPLPLSANVTNISAEFCIAMLDVAEGRLIEGTTAATIRGRTGSQPADPDASETGTLLFTLTCSDPDAIAAAVDDTDGTCSATFNSITDDTSADATGTLSYCRIGATGTGADDHIDGNATTDGSGATDWNTLSIVSGSNVSMTSAVLNMSQGSTAS